MEETYLTEVIILNRQPFREHDLQITVYSRDRGKLFLIARGGKKAKSKLAAHLEPLCRAEIMAVRGRRYDYVGSVVSTNCYARLKSDYVRVGNAMKAARMMIQAVKEGVPDEDIFELFRSFLDELNTGKLSAETALSFFTIKFLAYLGFAPELYQCVLHRGKISPGGNRFDFVRSGLVCPKCRASAGSLPVTDNSIKILRLALQQDFGQLKKIKTGVKIQAELIKLTDLFYKYSIN